jgi:hypothetical protein
LEASFNYGESAVLTAERRNDVAAHQNGEEEQGTGIGAAEAKIAGPLAGH